MRRLPLLLSILSLALFVNDAVLRLALWPTVPWPSLLGGVHALTLLLMAFSLFHAWHSLGGRHTLLFFALSAVISWAFEQVGVATGLVYGPYHYTDLLGPRLGHVPLLIPLAWFMMIYPSYVLANAIADARPTGTHGGLLRVLWLALLSAMIMTAWDVVMDPIMSGPEVRAWVWEEGGAYLGVPLHNFVGWLATTLVVYFCYRLYEWRVPPRPLGPLPRWVAALPVLAYAAMAASDLLVSDLGALDVIGPFVMGLPIVAAGRLGEYRGIPSGS